MHQTGTNSNLERLGDETRNRTHAGRLWEKPILRIYVLTRTSDRPAQFKRCRESVLAQEGVDDVVHVVSIDRPCRYVEGDIIVPARGAIRPAVPDFYKDQAPAEHNLYINDLLDAIDEDGWVIVLDDDDEFMTRDSLARLAPHLREDNLVICKFVVYDRLIPPDFGTKVPMHFISGSCFVFHAKHRKAAYWFERYGGDGSAACNLAARLPVTWVDEVIAGAQGMLSAGKMEKVAYQPWHERHTSNIKTTSLSASGQLMP